MIYFPDDNGKSVTAKKFYFSDNDKAKPVKKLYIGDENGKAKLVYSWEKLAPRHVYWEIVTYGDYYGTTEIDERDVDEAYGVKICSDAYFWGFTGELYNEADEELSNKAEYKLYKKDSNGEFTIELGSLPYIIPLDVGLPTKLSDYEVIGKLEGYEDVTDNYWASKATITKPYPPNINISTSEEFFEGNVIYVATARVDKPTGDYTEMRTEYGDWVETTYMRDVATFYARCYNRSSGGKVYSGVSVSN